MFIEKVKGVTVNHPLVKGLLELVQKGSWTYLHARSMQRDAAVSQVLVWASVLLSRGSACNA